jgi:hypothetical protein
MRTLTTRLVFETCGPAGRAVPLPLSIWSLKRITGVGALTGRYSLMPTVVPGDGSGHADWEDGSPSLIDEDPLGWRWRKPGHLPQHFCCGITVGRLLGCRDRKCRQATHQVQRSMTLPSSWSTTCGSVITPAGPQALVMFLPSAIITSARTVDIARHSHAAMTLGRPCHISRLQVMPQKLRFSQQD